MKIRANLFQFKKLFMAIFMAGFLAGILFANIIGKNYMTNTGIISDYFFNKYIYLDIAYTQLFIYIVRERLKSIILPALFGVTILGVPFVWAVLGWYGFSAGLLLSTAVLKFGFKGILICAGGVLPQYILYIPALLLLLNRMYLTSSMLYQKKLVFPEIHKTKNQLLLEYLIVFMIVVGIILLGSVLESFVSPGILKSILKRF